MRVLFASLLLCAACSTTEDAFLEGRNFDACTGVLPVCGTNAGCVLDATNYTSGSFAQGAARRVIVRTTTAMQIEVALYFRTEQGSGTDTEITWNEVGCRDHQMQGSNGKDVFAEAGGERVWKRTATVTSAGDHLIEVFSDAQADYHLKVSLLPPQ